MNIRPATPDDAVLLAQVHVDSWRAAYRGLVPDSYLDRLDYDRRAVRFRESLAAGSEETYLAEENGEVLGFLTLGACRDDDVDRTITGEIWGIYLAPAHWRKGVGRRLCQRGEQILRARGYTLATLWVFEGNDQARQFYRAMGFAPDGASKILDVGAPLKAIRYRKQLNRPNQSSHKRKAFAKEGTMRRDLRPSNHQAVRVLVCLFIAACSLLVLAGCARQSLQAPPPAGSAIASAFPMPTPLVATPGPSRPARLPTTFPTSTPPTWPALAGNDVLPAPLYLVSNYRITRIEPDGKTRKTMTGPTGGEIDSFDVSPVDGTVVMAGEGRLWLTDGDDKPPTLLLTGLPNREGFDDCDKLRDPVWSPDGRQIAYADGGIRVLDVASGRRTDLVENPGFRPVEFGVLIRLYAECYREPRWSPRGDAIVFVRQTPDYHTLMLARLGDKQVDQVPGTLGVAQADAAWSPDGKALLFDYWWSANVAEIAIAEPSFVQVTLADLQGRALWPHGDRADHVYASASNNPRQIVYPFQGRDGRILYFQAEPCDNGFCYNYSLTEGIITQDRFEARVLDRNVFPRGVDDVAWHESGKYVAFVIDQGDSYFIAVLRVDTGEMFTLSKEEYRPLYLRWGKQ